jgi:hypothetical protein
MRNGLKFSVDDSVFEDENTEGKGSCEFETDSMPSFRPPTVPIFDDSLVDEPGLGSYEELARTFKDITEDGGVKKKVSYVSLF